MRERITDQEVVRQFIDAEYGSYFFEGATPHVQTSKHPDVSAPGFKTTLSRMKAGEDRDEDKMRYDAVFELNFSEWMLRYENGEILNPLRGIKSDVLMHDLRLDQKLSAGDEVRFLFGWTKISYGDDPTRPEKIEFYVIDNARYIDDIEYILAVHRHSGESPKWFHDPIWESSCLEIQGSKPCIIKFGLRETNDCGISFDFSCYQLGARMPDLTRDNKFLWTEENLKYDNYESFVADRSDYVRTLCERLLQRYENGEDTNVSLEELLTLDDHCNNLNRRIIALRRHEGLKGLETYNVRSGCLEDPCLVSSKSSMCYTATQAYRHITQFEHLVNLRDVYAECFWLLEPKIKEVCGCLSTDNVRFAEIKVPARQSASGGKVMDTHQFGYTPQGVKAAIDWLDAEQAAFSEGISAIKEQFQLELKDGILQPVKQDS